MEKITQHHDFWYSDGSVVLIVEKTGFRIHQSVLTRYSDVFADLFTVPQPENAGQIGGCPVVHLPDSLPDFLDLLKALYNPFHFDNLPADADLLTLLTFISGILRISTKYNMQVFRKKCISVLQQKFPSTLAGCDLLLASQYQYIPSAVVRAIPLARETNVPEILPWAFYISTHIEIDALLSDVELSWKDKALCLAGKEHLWSAQKVHTHPFLFDFVRSPACQAACRSRPPVPSMGWRESEAIRKVPHPLELHTSWPTMGVCATCLKSIQAQHATGREKLWQMLPEIFQLGDWDDIRRDQNR